MASAEKKKKNTLIALAVIGAILFVMWLLSKRTPVQQIDTGTTQTDTQDAYYQTYNNPPVIMPGGGGSSQYDFGDIVTNSQTTYGATAADLDRIADKICGCVSNKCGTKTSANLSNAFNALLNIPQIPSYLREYVAPPTLAVSIPTLTPYTAPAPPVQPRASYSTFKPTMLPGEGASAYYARTGYTVG